MLTVLLRIGESSRGVAFGEFTVISLMQEIFFIPGPKSGLEKALPTYQQPAQTEPVRKKEQEDLLVPF